MRFSLVLGLFIGLALASTSPASSCPYTPARGSAERQAIMNALRGPVSRALEQGVIFVVRSLKVCDGWAALDVSPRQPDGRAINYRATRFREAIEEGFFDEGTLALLKNRGGGHWQVVEYAIGSTDYPLPDWIRQNGAPSAIIP